MRRMKILGKALSEGEIAVAVGLAKEAGCTDSELETVESIGDPVEDHHGNSMFCSRLHDEGECTDIGIESNSYILNVKQDQVDTF